MKRLPPEALRKLIQMNADLESMGFEAVATIYWDGKRVLIITEHDMSNERKTELTRQIHRAPARQHELNIEEAVEAIKALSRGGDVS